MRIAEKAHAKINLALHVTGQRSDGYHLLDTLVTFTETGDEVTIDAAGEDRFTLSGRFAGDLDQADPSGNLVIRARDGLRRLLLRDGRTAPPVHIHLEKNLPVASGIGGGSADAAACLRGLMRLWAAKPDGQALADLALGLGADVPMCLLSRPLVARGIGDILEPVALPPLSLLLVNPLKPVSTPAIFRRLTNRHNPPMGTISLEGLPALRNDLQPAAEALEPAITEVLAALRATGATLQRMSGSGATCFGLYPGIAAAREAAERLEARQPGWFVEATTTLR